MSVCFLPCSPTLSRGELASSASVFSPRGTVQCCVGGTRGIHSICSPFIRYHSEEKKKKKKTRSNLTQQFPTRHFLLFEEQSLFFICVTESADRSYYTVSGTLDIMSHRRKKTCLGGECEFKQSTALLQRHPQE